MLREQRKRKPRSLFFFLCYQAADKELYSEKNEDLTKWGFWLQEFGVGYTAEIGVAGEGGKVL